MLTLYHAPLSPCAQKVRLVLHEKDLPYEGQVIDLMKKENLKPEYLALNPNGVVPTLVDDGTPIIESSIICEYLDDRFPDVALRPADPVALAGMRLWAKRVDDKIHPSSGVLLFGAIVRNFFAGQAPEERAAMLVRIPDPARRERQADLLENGLNSHRLPAAIKSLKDMVDGIDAATARTPWMLGDRLSLTDFLLAPYVRVIESLGLQKVFTDRPAMSGWFARIKETRGYKGGMAPWETKEDADQRAPLLPAIVSKVAPLF